MFPALHMFDGAKVDLTSMLSPSFQVTHSFAWASQLYPPTYHFGAGFVGSRLFLQSQVDSEGNLSGRANYSWPSASVGDAVSDKETPPSKQRPASQSKLQVQIAPAGGPSMLQIEHDHLGSDYALTLKAVNPNPADSAPRFAGQPQTKNASTTGIFVAQFLQSVTSSVALGAELIYQRPTPEIEEPALSLVAKWAPRPTAPLPNPPSLPAGVPSPYAPVNPLDPHQSLTATLNPASGLLHSSYWRRINSRLELAAEVQLLATPSSSRIEGRREAVATVGFKLDTLFATMRGSVDSAGKISAVLEERLAQGLSFQVPYLSPPWSLILRCRFSNPHSTSN